MTDGEIMIRMKVISCGRLWKVILINISLLFFLCPAVTFRVMVCLSYHGLARYVNLCHSLLMIVLIDFYVDFFSFTVYVPFVSR